MKKLGLIVLLIVLAAAASNLTGGNQSGADLKLNVRLTTDRLGITNNGSATVSRCKVLVNSQFQRDYMTFPVGETVNIQMASLIGSGVRFNPTIDTVERIHVLCSDPTSDDALFKP